MPLVERLPELTARPPGRLRAVRAAAADPLARHDGGGLHPRDRRPPRPPRHPRGATGPSSGGWPSWCDPAGALVLNAEDPVVGRLRRTAAARRPSSTAAATAGRAGSASSTAGSSRTASSAWGSPAADRRRPARTGGSCRVDELAMPGAHNVSNALAAVAVGLLFGIAPGRHPRGRWPRSPASSTGWSRWRSSTASASSTTRRGPSRTRSSPPCAPSAADRADRRRPRQGRRPVATWPPWSRSGRPRPCSSARAGRTSSAGFRAAGLARTERAGDARGRRPVGRRDRPRGPGRDATGGARRAGDGPAQPGGRELRHVHRLRRARARRSRRRSPALAAERDRGRDR